MKSHPDCPSPWFYCSWCNTSRICAFLLQLAFSAVLPNWLVETPRSGCRQYAETPKIVLKINDLHFFSALHYMNGPSWQLVGGYYKVSIEWFHPSIHPSLSPSLPPTISPYVLISLSGAGQQSVQRFPDFPLPSDLLQLTRGILRHSRSAKR